MVADDLTVTDALRVRAAAELKAANTLLIKPNQRGTLTETRAAWDAARAAGWGGIASARSGETEDVMIVHLAIGWGVPQLKVGSFARLSAWRSGTRRCASRRHWERTPSWRGRSRRPDALPPT